MEEADKMKEKGANVKEARTERSFSPGFKRPRSNPPIFMLDSDEEECEVVQDSCVPGSLHCDDHDFFDWIRAKTQCFLFSDVSLPKSASCDERMCSEVLDSEGESELIRRMCVFLFLVSRVVS